MNVTATPAPKSSVVLEIELPPERLDRAVVDAVRRLSRRTRVAGFRPGKAPRAVLERVLGPEAIIDEAIEHLVSDSYRSAVLERDIVPLTNAGRRGRAGRGGQAGHLQGHGPGPARR